MPLSECMRAHTHWQYLAWMEWLDRQWEQPNRSDLYSMQVACEVRRVLAKNPNKIQLKDFVITFGDEASKPKISVEQSTMYAKQSALSQMTVSVTHKTITPEEAARNREFFYAA